MLRFFVFISVLTLSAINHADSCQSLFLPLSKNIHSIQQQLLSSNTQALYQKQVRSRYDALSQYLDQFLQCDASNLDQQAMRTMQKTRMLLSSLQASAKASAFTKFSDWMQAKELDLQLCDQLLAVKP